MNPGAGESVVALARNAESDDVEDPSAEVEDPSAEADGSGDESNDSGENDV
jgi:hypothetical protein